MEKKSDKKLRSIIPLDLLENKSDGNKSDTFKLSKNYEIEVEVDVMKSVMEFLNDKDDKKNKNFEETGNLENENEGDVGLKKIENLAVDENRNKSVCDNDDIIIVEKKDSRESVSD